MWSVVMVTGVPMDILQGGPGFQWNAGFNDYVVRSFNIIRIQVCIYLQI